MFMSIYQNSDTTFVTIAQAAKLTGLSRCYIRDLCKQGKAPCIRCGVGSNATYKINYSAFCEALERLTAGGIV